MKLIEDIHQKKKQTLSALRTERQPWWQHWREIADFYLPNRYLWLQSPTERQQRATNRNSYILDGTGTIAARTLASGMMNGITSPARPWFRLRVSGFADDLSTPARIWLDEVQRRMMLVMAESNFYNSMATLYLDLVVFGTAASLIYEDSDNVIHCFNPCLGEYYLGQSAQHRVNTFAREFTYTVAQVVEEFGEENCSESTQAAYRAGGARLQESLSITHLIEPNLDGKASLGRQYRYREYYWETGGPLGLVLREQGYFDFPGLCPRWELAGNDPYGTSPAMDALGDVKQLQHETKKKAQGLDKLVSPPILADIQLEHKPTALLPNGITYVARLGDTAGARPIYTVNPPLGEMTADIREVQSRIREIFHNDLFQMISQLDTVRSATEIDARREEKLVLLGPVLERFENEALDPAIKRIYGIMERKGMLPEAPPEIGDANLEIQYVSILSTAQAAVATAPTERFLQVIGNVAQIWPQSVEVPDIIELLHDYGTDIGVKAKNLKPKEAIQAALAAQQQQAAQQQGLDQMGQIAGGAELLSRTEVGGGANALQRLLGG